MRKTISDSRFLCRILAVALFLVCSLTAVQAQSSDTWKEKPITLRVSNQPLGKVLEMVAEAAGATITLQDVSLWNINKPINLAVKDKPLDKVLGGLIGDQNIKIRYESDNHIIVEPDGGEAVVGRFGHSGILVVHILVVGGTHAGLYVGRCVAATTATATHLLKLLGELDGCLVAAKELLFGDVAIEGA